MVFTYTQTDNIIGTIHGGLKVVSTTVTVTDADGAATQITVRPLTRIISFIPSFKTNVANIVTTVFAAGTNANQVSVDPPAGGINTAVIEIVSFGV